MSWKDHEFDLPIGIELPEAELSSYEDWWEDCEEDDIFDIKPCYYETKEKYDAALKLCRVCAGWFYFENNEDMESEVELLKGIILSDKNSPLNYYSIQYGRFDWITALRENNEKYSDQLYDISELWDLFFRLSERSILEKALCYEWFVSFFKDYLKYDRFNMLQNSYIQNYGNELEMILYLRPNQIELLTTGSTAVAVNNMVTLSSAAAGLIRLGRRKEGIELYKRVFELAWKCKATSDIKKDVMDGFITRLSKGYGSDPYIDEEIEKILEEQCNKFTDAKWISKIKVSLARNGI